VVHIFYYSDQPLMMALNYLIQLGLVHQVATVRLIEYCGRALLCLHQAPSQRESLKLARLWFSHDVLPFFQRVLPTDNDEQQSAIHLQLNVVLLVFTIAHALRLCEKRTRALRCNA